MSTTINEISIENEVLVGSRAPIGMKQEQHVTKLTMNVASEGSLKGLVSTRRFVKKPMTILASPARYRQVSYSREHNMK